MVGTPSLGNPIRFGWNVHNMDYRKTTKSAYPIILYEPITKLEFLAGMMVEHNRIEGDEERITIVFHNIIIPPEDLVKATQDFRGMILLPKNNETSGAYLVSENMKKIGEGIAHKMRVWHVFGYLVTIPIQNPLDISEAIETQNAKLLEEDHE